MFRPLGPITRMVRRGTLPEAFGACGSRGPLACAPPVTTSRAIVGPGDRDRSVWNRAGTTVTIVYRPHRRDFKLNRGQLTFSPRPEFAGTAQARSRRLTGPGAMDRARGWVKLPG